MDWDELTADIEKAISTRLDTLQSNIDAHHQILKSTITKLNSFTILLQDKFPTGLFPIAEAKKQTKPPSIPGTPKSAHPINLQNKESKVLHQSFKRETPSKSEEGKSKLEEAKRKKEEEDLKKKENLAKKKEEEEKKKEENKKKLEETKEKKKQEDIEKKKQEEVQKRGAEEQKAKKRLAEEEKKIKKEGEVKKKAVEEPNKIALVAGEEKKQEAGKSKIAQPRGLKPPTSLLKPKATVALPKSPSKESLKSESPALPDVKILPNLILPPEDPEPIIITENLAKPESPILLDAPVLIEKPVERENPVQIKSPVYLENQVEHSSYSNRRSSFDADESLLDPIPENFSGPSKSPSKFLKRSSFSVTLHSPNEDWTSQNFLSRTNTDPSILAESLARSVIPAEITQDEISLQLQLLESHYSEVDLNTEKRFDLSVGAKSALSLLTTMDDEKFHLNKVPKEEVIWSFRLFFRFTGKNLCEDPNAAWTECQEFIRSARDKELNKKSVDKVVLDVINNFDFTDENVDQIEEFIKGKEQFLQPQFYTELCPMTGLFMFAIREASIYAGVIKGKIPIWRQYKRLLHKRQQLVGSI